MDAKERGKSTTEFWLAVGYFVAVIADGTNYVSIPQDNMLYLAIIAGVYTGGRSFVKGKTKEAPQ